MALLLVIFILRCVLVTYSYCLISIYVFLSIQIPAAAPSIDLTKNRGKIRLSVARGVLGGGGGAEFFGTCFIFLH